MDVKDYFADYTNFVDAVTAEVSRKDDLFADRFAELSKQLNGNYSRLDNAVAGLMSESGEVGDLWKKVKYHGLAYDEESKQKFIKELGDVCWYLFQTALALNISVKEIIDTNIEKLKLRHPHGFSSAYMYDKKSG